MGVSPFVEALHRAVAHSLLKTRSLKEIAFDIAATYPERKKALSPRKVTAR